MIPILVFLSTYLAHISDIHFFHLAKTPLQFFSKRFLGNLYHLFKRRSSYNPLLAYDLLSFLQELNVSHLIISGDFTCSSSKKEFQIMQDYIDQAKKKGFTIFALPGNHDVYTQKAYKNQLFFSYLHNLVNFFGDTPHNLIDHRVAAFQLQKSWWLILLHCSFPLPWTKSNGIFAPHTEQHLKTVLSLLPQKAHLIIACHFPYEGFRKNTSILERGERLQKIIQQDKRISLYLHGHLHSPYLQKKEELLITDSGSISFTQKSSFNLIKLQENRYEIKQYKKDLKKFYLHKEVFSLLKK